MCGGGDVGNIIQDAAKAAAIYYGGEAVGAWGGADAAASGAAAYDAMSPQAQVAADVAKDYAAMSPAEQAAVDAAGASLGGEAASTTGPASQTAAGSLTTKGTGAAAAEAAKGAGQGILDAPGAATVGASALDTANRATNQESIQALMSSGAGLPTSAVGTSGVPTTPVSIADMTGVDTNVGGGLDFGGLGGNTTGLGDNIVNEAARKAAEKTGDNWATNALSKLGLYDPVKGALGPNALPAALLGTNLYAQMAANTRGQSLQKDLTRAAQPASDISKKLTEMGLSGQVGPNTTYQIDQWLQNTLGAIDQRYANMGRDPNNDSAAAKEKADANAHAVALRDQAAQAEIAQGLNATGVAAGPAQAAAIAGAQQDQALSQSMGGTLQTLAMLQAMRAGGGG